VKWADVTGDLLLSYQYYRKHMSGYLPKVVMPTLYGGVSQAEFGWQDNDEIVVLDAAHSMKVNTQADFVFHSFHSQKPIRTPDGGMICTNDDSAATYMRRYRNMGRNPGGQHDQNGFKFCINQFSAELALENLERETWKHDIVFRRANYELLRSIVQCRTVEHDEDSTYNLFTVILPSFGPKAKSSGYIADKLLCVDIETAYHYFPLNKMPKNLGNDVELLNVNYLQHLILNLPIHEELSASHIAHIGNTLNDICNS